MEGTVVEYPVCERMDKELKHVSHEVKLCICLEACVQSAVMWCNL